jgi:hypothetical protein
MIILNIICSFLIIYFILFALFWSECKHTKIFRVIRKEIYHLGFDHSWAVFSIPIKRNQNLLLSIEYEDEKRELINLLDCRTMLFLNRKLNTFDEKYAESLISNIRSRTNFIYYVKSNIEKNKNKKIKKILFLEEMEHIKVWDSNLNSNFTNVVLKSSHKF